MSIKITSRGKGKSAVAAAAYRAGEKITNLYDGVTHDYTRKSGVAHTEILLPDHVPRKYFDRAVLWNAVEQTEKTKNAQLAREIELALPVELSQEENIALARDYCQRHFVAAGMCADICIHDKDDGNPHAHVLLTMRAIEPDGSWAAKCRKEYILDKNGQRITLPSGEYKSRKVDATDWNDRGKAEVWRQGWAEAVNAVLEHAGHAERIDHRSYERQGVEKIPTVHLGIAASAMEKRGIRTEQGDINRQIELGNKMLRQLRARINKLQVGLDELLAEAAAVLDIPTLADTLTGILERPEEKTRRQKITDLKTFASAIIFVQENRIADLPSLRDKVVEMYSQQHGINDSLKKIDRRAKTLEVHLLHADKYFEYLNIHRQHQKLPAKKQAAFYETHRVELTLYDAAKRYLDEHLNGYKKIPTAAWKKEAAELADQRRALYAEYTLLKDEVKDAENIRRAVEDVMRDAPQKNVTRDISL